MTLVSRVFGLVRDVVVARLLGATAASDAFVIAFRIPNMLRRLFAEGSFASGFVPVFNEYRRTRSRAELRELVDAVAGALLAALTLVVALGLLLAPGLARLFAWDEANDAMWLAHTTAMLRITFPYVLFISLTAMAAAILNSVGRFALPAFVPVVLNLTLIAAAVLAAPAFAEPATALALGVLVAGLLQLAMLLGPLRRLGLLPKPRLDLAHAGVRRIGALMLPTLASSGVYQINLMVDTFMASLIASGAVTWLYYSDRLLEFPLGLFGIAVSTVILPTLSRRHVDDDRAGFVRTLDWGLKLSLLIALPAALGLALLAGPITSALFERGAFEASDARMAAASLVALAAGLPAHGFNKILLQGFFSRQNTKEPMVIAIATMATNVVLNVALVALLLHWGTIPAHVGLAAASTLTAWLQTALLLRGLARADALPSVAGWPRHLLALLLASAAMTAVVLALGPDMERWATQGLVERLGALAIPIVGGAVSYLLAVAALGALRRELFDAPA